MFIRSVSGDENPQSTDTASLAEKDREFSDTLSLFLTFLLHTG
jgi:hypothetical protein